MSSVPSYYSNEIFRAAEMDSSGKYIIVEGEADKPIFSELLRMMFATENGQSRAIIGAGGGKPNILSWLESKRSVNVKVVLDRDFDDIESELIDQRIVPLDVYSIENYYFSKDVISPLFAHLTNSTIDEVESWLDLEGMVGHWSNTSSKLLAALYYYQKRFGGEKDGWGGRDIVQNRDNWELCPRKISSMTDDLLKQMGDLDLQVCIDFFNNNFPYDECFSKSFPGKLLKKSMYRYLKGLCEDRGGEFSSITNVEQLMQSLTPRLMCNNQIKGVLNRLVS